MTAATAPLLTQLHLNTRLLLNCLEGLSEETAQRRPNDRTNSITFVACHLVESRHYLAARCGAKTTNPFATLLRDARRIEDVPHLPPLVDVRAAWMDVSRALDEALSGLDDEALARPSAARFPVDDRSLLGMVAFLLQHESYHLGQLGLLRKFFGHEAMRYR